MWDNTLHVEINYRSKSRIILFSLFISYIVFLLILLLISTGLSIASSTKEVYDFEESIGSGLINCGGSNWMIDPHEGYSSGSSLRSGKIEGIGISSICRDIDGPAYLGFYWKMSGIASIAELSFLVDGRKQMICQSLEWERMKYAIPSGKHRISWEFRKVVSVIVPEVAGWIDDITIETHKSNPETPYTGLTTNELKNIIEARVEPDSPVIRNEAVLALSKNSGDLNIAQISEVYDHLMNGWVYRSNPRGNNFYQYANETLKLGEKVGSTGIGDCTDFAIIISSLIESIGGTTRIILAHNNSIGEHAYAEVYLGNMAAQGDQIEDALNWLKKKYKVDKIYTHIDASTKDVWMNLDYGESIEGKSNPGGPYFSGTENIVIYKSNEPDKTSVLI